ncbi:DnaJ C-terminal domain-containing protein [Mycoplasma hafezii]|uniref:DnaJ C-terminal domain-containing protein n=1 Tax=Mycoplasma hafezii TaxID=525886 RepID=UPI003CF64DAF
MNNNKDLYSILGVDKNATQQEIKTAYRKLAKKYHPDVLKDGTSDQKMKDLNEAYSVLSDEEKRKQYDQFGMDGVNGQAGFGGASGFSGFGDIFENIFGGFGGFEGFGPQNRNKGPQHGDDYQMIYEISFMDAIHGTTFEKEFTKYELCLHCGGTGAESKNDLKTCNVCHGRGMQEEVKNGLFGQHVSVSECRACSGTGKMIEKKCSQCNGQKYIKVKKMTKVTIPAGSSNSTKLKLAGFGGIGHNGGPSGDLYIKIQVKPHKFFTREGNNILITIPVSFIDLMLENTITIPTPYGNEKIRLKKSYQNGQFVMIKGKGVKTASKVGDLYFKIQVIAPELSRSDTKLIKETLEKVHDTTNEDFVNIVNSAK